MNGKIIKNALKLFFLIKIRGGLRLLITFLKRNKIPIKWKILFLESLFIQKKKFCIKFQKILQGYKRGDYYDFNGLKVFFYPFESTPDLHSAEYFVINFLNLILPILYGGNIYHPLSYLEANYFDDRNMRIDPSDIVFDCGGFIGHFTIGASLKANKGKIFVFEPFLENFTLLLKNLDLNKRNNVVLIQKAVSDQENELKFCFQTDVPSGSGIYTKERAKYGYARMVKCITIDQIYKEYHLEKVDFIKMDIEGMERKALTGAKEVISKFKPKLSICTYHLPDDQIVLPKIIKKIRKDYTIEMKIDKLYAY